MKTKTLIKFSDNKLFDLKNMIGCSVWKFFNFIEPKGFRQNTKTVNDYTWHWQNDNLKIRICAKIDFIDCEELDNEIIVDIWYYEYNEN
jgi:hypothetical protein